MPTAKTITATRVNSEYQYDRETSTFSCPMLVADSGGKTSTVLIPYLLNIDHERITYEYIDDGLGNALTEAAALTLAATVKSELTKNVDVISVTQTTADTYPEVTTTTIELLCGTVAPRRLGSSGKWVVAVQEDTPTYSVVPLVGNPIEGE